MDDAKRIRGLLSKHLGPAATGQMTQEELDHQVELEMRKLAQRWPVIEGRAWLLLPNGIRLDDADDLPANLVYLGRTEATYIIRKAASELRKLIILARMSQEQQRAIHEDSVPF